jgi:hypothetical protein
VKGGSGFKIWQLVGGWCSNDVHELYGVGL